MSAEPTTAKNEAEPTETIKKPSRLSKIKDAAITTGIIAIPTVCVGASFVYGWKVNSMALETAKLNLEAAALRATEAATS